MRSETRVVARGCLLLLEVWRPTFGRQCDTIRWPISSSSSSSSCTHDLISLKLQFSAGIPFSRGYRIDDLVHLEDDPLYTVVAGQIRVLLIQIRLVSCLEQSEHMACELRTHSTFRTEGSDSDDRTQRAREVSLFGGGDSRQRGQNGPVCLDDER